MPSRPFDKICANPLCGKAFKNRTKRVRCCSRHCGWAVSKGPEYNAKLGNDFAKKIGNARRGSGKGQWYVKVDGKHEHRTVIEEAIGRKLLFTEVVHHIDGNKRNNDLSNLKVMSRAEHMREHGIAVPGVTPPWVQKKRKDSKC